jgi:hypothetical protein
MINFLKFLLELSFHNVNLDCHSCMEKFAVSIQAHMTWIELKEKRV